MFEIVVEESFSSGHALRGYRGKCENPHGHNYRAVVCLAGPELNSIGLLYDFTELKRMIRLLTDRLDHQYLNDLVPFLEINPSAENLAKYLYEGLRDQFEGTQSNRGGPTGIQVKSVRVFETDRTSAAYSE
ncbi:MAG: 6-carboxytetrahydropterin synthase QueD [Acetobacteraceae bacterium]